MFAANHYETDELRIKNEGEKNKDVLASIDDWVSSPDQVTRYNLDEQTKKSLWRAFENRWRNLQKRTEKMDLELPNKDTLWKKVEDCWMKGFRCAYCGRQMVIKDDGQSLRSFSFDHRIALSKGGDNSIDNLIIVCNRCNTAKGTLPESTFRDILSGKRVASEGVSLQMSEFFKINERGWSSDYKSIDNLLKHLSRRSKSESTKKTYLQQIKSFCFYVKMCPDDLIEFPKKKVEDLVQRHVDTFNTPNYSRRTANSILAVLKSFFEINGFNGSNALNVEGYYIPTRYRKTEEYIPQKYEIYLMADCTPTPSIRNRAIILTLYSSGLRNATIRALRYKDVKDELLQGIDNLKIPAYPEMKQVIPSACKNNLPYYTFICSEATDALKLYLQERANRYGKIGDDDPLFASDYNQIDREVRSTKFMTSRQLQKIVKSSAKLAGIERWKDVKPHTLRKAFETVIHSENSSGNILDPKIQEFLMGHTLPGSQDNYFDPTRVEEIRAEYSKLKFNRVLVGNKFERLRNAVAEAFQGTGENPDEIIEKYVERKKRLKRALDG